jgi:hypothetical protein
MRSRDINIDLNRHQEHMAVVALRNGGVLPTPLRAIASRPFATSCSLPITVRLHRSARGLLSGQRGAATQ